MKEWADLKEKIGILFSSVILHNEGEQNMPFPPPAKCATLAYTLFSFEGIWRQSRSSKLRKALCLPLSCLKELQKGTCTRKRVINRGNFIWEIYLQSRANICLPNTSSSLPNTSVLFIFLSTAFSPLKSKTYTPFLSSDWYISVTSLTAFESPIFMGLLYVRS